MHTHGHDKWLKGFEKNKIWQYSTHCTYAKTHKNFAIIDLFVAHIS